MSKKDIAKQLIVPAVKMGIGIEGLVRSYQGTEDLSVKERMDQSTPTQNALRTVWSFIKIGTTVFWVTTVVKEALK